VRKRLLRVLVSAVIPVVLGLSAVGITSASASTGRAVSPAPAAHSSRMRIAAISRFPAARLKVREAGRGTASRAATGIPEVSALSGEFCYYGTSSGLWACLNAWGGGPWVKAYTGGPNGTENNYFEAVQETDGYWYIAYTGNPTSPWYGYCIGDAYNKSGNADTSLDPCGTGWGTNFRLVHGPGYNGCPTGNYYAFENIHWPGWLGPIGNPTGGWTNGSVFYLNKPQEFCFGLYS
jgi:hypothetical protein